MGAEAMTAETRMNQWALDTATRRIVWDYLHGRKMPTQAMRKLARKVLERLEERYRDREAPEGMPAELRSLQRPRDAFPRHR